MTNPNNGASLEDCHSNFFALTDLCGIKWRRLVSDGYLGSSGHHAQHHHHHQTHGPLDDPVLSSYARCLASDILCVWRRSPNAKQNQSIAQDLFQPQTGTQTSPHFMHSGPPGGLGSSSQQNQSQLGMQHHNMQMMSPHLLGPGSHHPHSASPGMVGAGPPPYSSGQHSHQHAGQGFSTSLSPITSHSQQSLFNSSNANSSNSAPSLSGPKELWIFWYGEDPDLTTLVHSQLLKSETEQGSWENGLSYECRTLLFKALHNLIERCLLARDFVRIGKWFIQPSEDNLKHNSASGPFHNNVPGHANNSGHNNSSNNNRNNFPMQLSFSFAFFVHGESTVCMSVDVRQHPSVKRVSKQHLLACQPPNQTVPVILAPYGLTGALTGVGYRMSDPGTHKILEEWKQFYPVEAALKSPTYDVSTSTHGPHSSPHSATSGGTTQQQSSPGTNTGASASSSVGIPPVLEVIVGGVRMRYPSCYVLCTELDDLPKFLESNNSNANSTSSSAPVALKSKQSSNKATKDSETAACPAVKSPGRPQGSLTISQKVDKVEGILAERVWQETILPSQPLTKTQNEQSSSLSEQASPPILNVNDSAGQWDFQDPSKKSGCSCSKCKRPSGSKGMSSGSQSTKSGTKMKKSTFHKRSLQQLIQIESWATKWSLSEDPVCAPTNNPCLHIVNGPIKTENQGITNQQAQNRLGNQYS